MNKILIDLDFKNCKSDPCLYKRDSLYIGLYLDEIFIVGPKTLINNFVEEISKILSIRKYDEVLDFVGSQLIWNLNNNEVLIHQSKLSIKLINKFKKELDLIKVPITPGVPSLIITTPSKDDKLIDSESQTRFRSSVGSILYLVKISRPDLSNISRELSKFMMKCTSFHYSLLLRTLKYIEKTVLWNII